MDDGPVEVLTCDLPLVYDSGRTSGKRMQNYMETGFISGFKGIILNRYLCNCEVCLEALYTILMEEMWEHSLQHLEAC